MRTKPKLKAIECDLSKVFQSIVELNCGGVVLLKYDTDPRFNGRNFQVEVTSPRFGIPYVFFGTTAIEAATLSLELTKMMHKNSIEQPKLAGAA